MSLEQGRSSLASHSEDWERARRQLSGQPEPEPFFEEPVSESVPASEGWEPAPASPGHHLSEPTSEDEDGEGRSNSQRLVEKGIGKAEKEQMNQAGKNQVKGENDE